MAEQEEMEGHRGHLQAIYDRFGKVTPELVVEEARPKEHPLHGYVFDRAPREAAEAWYRHRAHELIRRVQVKYTPPGEQEPRRMRAFLSVHTPSGEHQFHPPDVVATDPEMRELVLRDMEREWRQLHTRYGHFEEFVSMVSTTMADDRELVPA